MQRINVLLQQFEVHLLLFCLGFFLLNWPFLGIFHHRSSEALFTYLFVVWAGLVLVLYVLSRSCREQAAADDRNKHHTEGS